MLYKFEMIKPPYRIIEIVFQAEEDAIAHAKRISLSLGSIVLSDENGKSFEVSEDGHVLVLSGCKMSKAKFTKGTWSFDSHAMDVTTVESGYVLVQVTQPEDYPCFSDDEEKRLIEEGIANGNLIAAAPEMYEVLKSISKIVDRDASKNTLILSQDLADKLLTAIGKAEGKKD